MMMRGERNSLPQDYGDLQGVFESFERTRKQYCWGIAGIMLFATAVGGLLAWHESSFGPFFFPIIFGWALSGLVLRGLQNDFKKEVVPETLKRFGMRYDLVAKTFQLRKFDEILPSYSRSDLEDHFWGAHQGVNFDIAEAKLSTGSGKNRREVFDGLLCEFSFPKSVAADVLVLPQKGGLSALFSSLFGSREQVRLEDVEFERHFDVYSTDQVGARYLLTPTMMQRLVSMNRQYGGIAVLFKAGRILMAINRGPDLFHPGSFLVPIDPAVVMRFQKEIKDFFGFIDELKLQAKTKV